MPVLSQRKIRCLQITEAGRAAIPHLVQRILAAEEDEAAKLAGQLHLALTPGFPKEGGLDAHVLRLTCDRSGGMTAHALLLALGMSDTRPMQRSFADLLTQMVDTGALKVTMRQEKRAFVQYFEPTHTLHPLVAQGEVLLDRPPDRQDMLSLVRAGHAARTKRSSSRTGRDEASISGQTLSDRPDEACASNSTPCQVRISAKTRKPVRVDEQGNPILGRPRKYPRDENGKPIRPSKPGPLKKGRPRKGAASVPEASVGDASGYIGDISIAPNEGAALELANEDEPTVDALSHPAAPPPSQVDPTATKPAASDSAHKRARSPEDEGTSTPVSASKRQSVLRDPATPDVSTLAAPRRRSPRLLTAGSPTPPMLTPTQDEGSSVQHSLATPLVYAATVAMSQSNAHISTQARRYPQRRSQAHGSSNVPPVDGEGTTRGGRWQVAAKRESMLVEAIKEQGGILDTVQLNTAFAEVVGRQEDEDARGMSMSDLKTRKTAISSLERQKRLQSTKVMTLAGTQRTVVFLPEIAAETKDAFLATLCETGRPPKIDIAPMETTDVAVQRTISVRVNSRRRAAAEEQAITDPDELLERWAESVRTGTAELHYSLGLIPGTMARLRTAYDAIRTAVATHAEGDLAAYNFNLDKIWLELPFVQLMQIMPPNYFGDAYQAKQYVENEYYRVMPIGELPKEVMNTFVNPGRIRQVLFNHVRTLRALGLARPVHTEGQDTLNAASAPIGEQRFKHMGPPAPEGQEAIPGPMVSTGTSGRLAKKHVPKPTVVWQLVTHNVPVYDWARAWDKDFLPKQIGFVDLVTEGMAAEYWSTMEKESLFPFCRPADAQPQAPNPHARSHLFHESTAVPERNLLPLTAKPEAVGRDALGVPRLANKSFPRFHSQSWRRGYFMIERQLGRVRQFRDLVGASRLESDPERLQGLADAIGAPVWVVVNYVSRLAQLEEVTAEKERMNPRHRRKRQRRGSEESEAEETDESGTDEELISDSEPLQRHVWADQAAADRRALRVKVGMKASEVRRNKFKWFDARLEEYLERFPAAQEERAFLVNHLRPHRAAWAAGHVDLTAVETRAMIRLTVNKTAESAVRRRGRVAEPRKHRERKGDVRVDSHGRVRFTRAKRAGLLKTDQEYHWTPEIEDVLRDCVAILRARDHVRGGKSSWVALAQVFTDLKHPAPTCRRKIAAMLQHSMSERTYLDRLEQEWMVVWQKFAGTADLPDSDPSSAVFDLRAHVLFLRRQINKAKVHQMGVLPLLISVAGMEEQFRPVAQPDLDAPFQMLFTGERAATKGVREDLEWTPWVIPSSKEPQQPAAAKRQFNRDQLLRSVIRMSLQQHKVLAEADLEILKEVFSEDQVGAALNGLCSKGAIHGDALAHSSIRMEESAALQKHEETFVSSSGPIYKLAKDALSLPEPPLSLSVWRQGQLELESVEPGFQPLDLPDAQALALIESFAHGQAELDVDLSNIPKSLTQISFSAKLLTDDMVELPVSYQPSVPTPITVPTLETCLAPTTEIPLAHEPQDDQLVGYGEMGQLVAGLKPEKVRDSVACRLGFLTGYDSERLVALSYAKSWTVDVAHLPRAPRNSSERTQTIIPARWMGSGAPNQEVWRAALSAVVAWLTFRPKTPLTQVVKALASAFDGVELRLLLSRAAGAGAIRLSPISNPTQTLHWEHARVLPPDEVAVEAQLFPLGV